MASDRSWMWWVGGGLALLLLGVGGMEAVSLIEKEEGLRLTAYQDIAGRWTIGYGHLIKPGEAFYPYGTVKTITQAQAAALLQSDTAAASAAITQYVRVPLNANQKAAITDFVFNVGEPAFVGSTLLRDLNAGNYAAVPGQMRLWDHVHDPATGQLVESTALLDRRDREAALFEMA